MNGEEENPDPRSGSVSLGLLLIGVALFFLIFAKDIEATGLGGNDDPGPRAFPVALAAALGAGGLYELARRRRDSRPDARPWRARAADWLAERGNRNILFLTAALALYLAAIPWLGFSPGTGLFAAALALRLGARPLVAALAAVTMVAAVELLFMEAFRVQLPEGVLGLPPLVELARRILFSGMGG